MAEHAGKRQRNVTVQDGQVSMANSNGLDLDNRLVGTDVVQKDPFETGGLSESIGDYCGGLATHG